MEIRVASLLSSFDVTGAGSAGCPAISLVPVTSPDASASCPALCIFGFCRRSIFRSPGISTPFGASGGFQVPGFPATLFRPCASRCITGRPSLCIFRPCRRLIIELPRRSRPSAPLLRRLRVSSLLRSSRCASQHRFQVYPSPCIFRLYRQRIFELPRTSRSSVPPVLELSVSLALRSARLLLPTTL